MIGRRAKRWVLAALAAGIGVGLIVVVLLFMFEAADPNATEDAVAGTWVSTSSEAPGTLVLWPGGRARVDGFTFYDQRSDPVSVVATGVSGGGMWELTQGQLVVSVPAPGGDDPYTLHLLVMASPLRGTFLQAIVGDPDGPRAIQNFRRAG